MIPDIIMALTNATRATVSWTVIFGVNVHRKLSVLKRSTMTSGNSNDDDSSKMRDT